MAARNHFTNRVDGIICLASDIRARLRRLTSSCYGRHTGNDEQASDAKYDVVMDFDAKAAHLLDNTYDEEDYDVLTLFKTSSRPNNKLQKFPDDIKAAKRANKYDHDDQPEDVISDDFLYNEADEHRSTTYEANRIDGIIKRLKTLRGQSRQ